MAVPCGEDCTALGYNTAMNSIEGAHACEPYSCKTSSSKRPVLNQQKDTDILSRH